MTPEGTETQSLDIVRREQREQTLRQTVQADPRHLDALIELGLLCFETARRQEAVGFFEQAVALDPNDPVSRASLGVVLLNQGWLDEARVQLQEGARLNPASVWCWHNLGMIHRRQRNYQQAVESFRRELELLPRIEPTQTELRMVPQAHAELGMALWQLHRYEEAMAEWKVLRYYDVWTNSSMKVTKGQSRGPEEAQAQKVGQARKVEAQADAQARQEA